MANKAVKSKVAVVSGNPNSPTGYGRKRVYTCTYDSTGTTNTISGLGQLKSGDAVEVLELQANTASGYAGIIWDTATTTYSSTAAIIGLKPTNSAPDADVNLLIIIDEL